ncbi:Leucine--tRNA ligase [Candidatus Fokinia solitaria]|uniref:Leucine--tRNA ligase n=1 Tax=Candidatus Fokinia solitaria TaxID=1802984 RepID=A0A2U8BRR1_9RICK|nr:leucine--tRNA ligase [Candidatus Fokinia solitaria]AWD33018.1 Leucine--tRNA ligase [Candidatus Fokinia solitaria]
MPRYNHSEIADKWQKYWKENEIFTVLNTETNKEKYYILSMFPYPSGKLHVGHIRNYSISDAIARFKRAFGYNVLHPVGWDAFGLPAENAAIEHNVHPKEWTLDNIEVMKKQLEKCGFSYDWSREIMTCSSDYCADQQYIFIEMLKHGLLYQKESEVNWDPIDKTVLANEQVIDGKGWRSGATIEKRMLTQWFFKITNFAEDLLHSLKSLNQWPLRIKSMQEKWIGRSEGAEIVFHISSDTVTNKDLDSITVFTTRPETIFGCTFIAIGPSHPIAKKLAQNDAQICAMLEEWQKSSTIEAENATKEKAGITTDLYFLHPIHNGKIPLIIVNYIIDGYGTNAVFGCPAHDERDFEIAKIHNFRIVSVIQDETVVNSDFLTGLSLEEARSTIVKYLEDNKIGNRAVNFRLRDWSISRQRYWGCPIPIIYCPKCGTIAANEESLPILLPKDKNLCKSEWLHTKCHICNSDATRETDTLDTFVESSWYFLKFILPNVPFKRWKDETIHNQLARWLPVDQYVGGAEHAVMHLIYSRFFTKALHQLGYIKFQEPFIALLNQGMVCHAAYKDAAKRWVDIKYVQKVSETGKYIDCRNGQEVHFVGVEKMSKSKLNGIDANDAIEEFGADAVRMFMLSDSPPDKDIEWSHIGIDGTRKYLNKIYREIINISTQNIEYALNENSHMRYAELDIEDSSHDLDMFRRIHTTIRLVTESYERHSFHKVIAFIRELSNTVLITEKRKLKAATLWLIIRLLHPIAPHITEECNQILRTITNSAHSLSEMEWPKYDIQYSQSQTAKIAIQINGKTRDILEMKLDCSQEEVEQQAKFSHGILKYIKGEIQKVIFIKNKILNFIIKN